MDYEDAMRKARLFNKKMDAVDRMNGVSTPRECSLAEFIRTIMAAIESGIRIESWSSVAEAQAMIEELLDVCLEVQNDSMD